MLGGFTLLPVGQESLLPGLLTINLKWDVSPSPGKKARHRTPQMTVLCLTRVGPK